MEVKEYRTRTVKDERYKTLNSTGANVSEIEKERFEGDNNFIDYFLVLGAKPEIYKNNYLYNSDSISEINNNLIPQIITKFPKIDKKYIVIENSIIQQIFPQGFNAIESETQPQPQFYSIILDNQLYSATYTNKFIACLLIYESISDYKILNDKYKSSDILFNTLRSNSIKVLKSPPVPSEKYKNFYIPKCLCLVSVYPAFNRFQEILFSLYNLVKSNQYNSLYIDRIIEKIIVEIPKLPRGHKKFFLKLPPNKTIDLTEKKMNDFPCINMDLPKFFACLDINNILEIFRFLLFETKLIFFGSNLTDLTNSIISILTLIAPFKYQFQVVSVLPKDLYNFIETISPYIFGINEKYDENFFKKNKINTEDATIFIVDIDNNKYYIRVQNEQVLNRDYPPFPKNLKEKIEKDYNKYKKEKESNNKTSESKDLNIKRDEENSEYQLIFYNFMISLLKDYPKFLSKDYGVTKDISMSIKDMIDITSYVNLYNANERDFYNRIFSTQMFIEFIYKRMMPKNYNERVEILFFEEKINEQKKKSFFKSKDIAPSILLSSNEYDYDNEIINIDCTNEMDITEKVKDWILINTEEAKKIFLNNGYDINIDEDKEIITFNYPIFPCLLSEKFFALNYEYYKKPEIYCNAIDAINLKIVNKSHLQFNINKSKELLSEEGNDLYLCYLIMWSLTLWYTDEWERELRFLQMIEIIEKVQGHDIQIFEILFKALVDVKWSDKDIILLYKKFIHLNLNPTWKIFSLVSKIIKKKANIKNKKELLSQLTKFEQLKIKKKEKSQKNAEENINFRSRTLKVKSVDDKILSEDVIFYAYGYCNGCSKNINLINLCSNLSQLKTKTVLLKNNSVPSEVLSNSLNTLSSNILAEDNSKKKGISEDYFKCPNKHQKEGIQEYIKFNLKLNHGLELFNKKLDSNSESTSVSYNTLLMSPSTIKKELLELAKKLEKEGKHLNVENFKMNHKKLFWNLAWYFELNGMDISFMLPYANDINQGNNNNNSITDLNLENLKKFVDIKYKPEKDINIEKIVNNKNKEIDFLICSDRNSLLGKNINEEDTKNHLFNKSKTRYEKYDLSIQKIFKFEINNTQGMISYLSFENYCENIGYNEYPSQYKEIEEINLGDSLINWFKSQNNESGDISINKNKINKSISLIDSYNNNIDKLDIRKNKNEFIHPVNKTFNKLKTEDFNQNAGNINPLIKKKLMKATRGALLKKPKKENINDENNDIVDEKNEIKENEEEEVDVLAKFKEEQKKLEGGKILESGYEQERKSSLQVKYNSFRRSTLKDGFLSGENQDINE